MDSDHQSAWTPRAVWLNTLATLLSAFVSVGALAIAVLALFQAL